MYWYRLQIKWDYNKLNKNVLPETMKLLRCPVSATENKEKRLDLSEETQQKGEGGGVIDL
jgi:hypothetical protein